MFAFGITEYSATSAAPLWPRAFVDLRHFGTWPCAQGLLPLLHYADISIYKALVQGQQEGLKPGP